MNLELDKLTRKEFVFTKKYEDIFIDKLDLKENIGKEVKTKLKEQKK